VYCVTRRVKGILLYSWSGSLSIRPDKRWDLGNFVWTLWSRKLKESHVRLSVSPWSVCPSVCPDERWDLGNYKNNAEISETIRVVRLSVCPDDRWDLGNYESLGFLRSASLFPQGSTPTIPLEPVYHPHFILFLNNLKKFLSFLSIPIDMPKFIEIGLII